MKKTKHTPRSVAHSVWSKLMKRPPSQQQPWPDDSMHLNQDSVDWDMSPKEALQIPTLKRTASNQAIDNGAKPSALPQPTNLLTHPMAFSTDELTTITHDIQILEGNFNTRMPQINRPAANTDMAKPTPTRGRVLVVDDSVTIRKLLIKILEGFGLEVSTATDGHDALAQLRYFKPNLIITELLMPTMSGTSLMNRIQRDSRLMHTPVIVIGSNMSESSIENLTAFGVADVLNKPFQMEEVHEVVSKFCSIPELNPSENAQKVIGIVSDCSSQRQTLRSLLGRQGYRVSVDSNCMNLDINLQANSTTVNAWIIGTTLEDQFEILDELEQCFDVPTLLGVESPPTQHNDRYAKWEGNILDKLATMLGQQTTVQGECA